ncbi:hypothetical protein RA27_22865 [Ruegeria sp. ANG-R]|nr:hypothetical protein RA27_22865 [Ruegeria sp. ANG-R]
MIVVTSLDASVCDTDEVFALYRTRCHIGLAFKRLKSLIHIERLPAKDPNLARAWLYSHLIFALLINTLSSNTLDSPPCGTGCQAT